MQTRLAILTATFYERRATPQGAQFNLEAMVREHLLEKSGSVKINLCLPTDRTLVAMMKSKEVLRCKVDELVAHLKPMPPQALFNAEEPAEQLLVDK